MSASREETPADPAAPARVRLGPIATNETLLDGGWWPRSSDPYAELPSLVRSIDHLHGPVRRLVLSAEGWADHPRHIRVGDRVIRLSFFDSQPPSLVTATCDGGHRVDLLVVAPGEQESTAEAAMAMAATSDNVVPAQDIADTVSIAPAPQDTDDSGVNAS